MDKDIILKTSFRGFNKKAVMDYIEELQKENLALKARVAELEEMILQDEVEVKEVPSENTVVKPVADTVVIDAEPAAAETASVMEAAVALPGTDSPKDTDDFDKMEAQLDEQFQKLVDEYAGEETSAEDSEETDSEKEEAEKTEPKKEKKGLRIRVRVKD